MKPTQRNKKYISGKYIKNDNPMPAIVLGKNSIIINVRMVNANI